LKGTCELSLGWLLLWQIRLRNGDVRHEQEGHQAANAKQRHGASCRRHDRLLAWCRKEVEEMMH